MNRFAAITIAILFAAMFGSPAHSEGFRIHDLTTIETEVSAVFGNEFYHWAIPTTINLSCCEDAGEQIVMLNIDRQNDEGGQKKRSDRAYIAELEEACATVGPSCEIENIDIGSALGRITTIRLAGGIEGTNIFLVKDGDRLTIQSAADNEATARKNAETALEAVRSSLLGQ